MDIKSLAVKKRRGKKGEGRKVHFTTLNLPVDLVEDLRLYRDVYSDCLPPDEDGTPGKVSFESMLRHWMDRVETFDPEVARQYSFFKGEQARYRERAAEGLGLTAEQLEDNIRSFDPAEPENTPWDLKYFFEKDGEQVEARPGDRAPFYARLDDRNVGLKEMLADDWSLMNEVGVELDYAKAVEVARVIREHKAAKNKNKLKITSAKYLHDYKILVHFNNGIDRGFDFQQVISRFPAFRILENKEVLKNFVITDTLEWENGNLDIAPEYILEHGIEVDQIPGQHQE